MSTNPLIIGDSDPLTNGCPGYHMADVPAVGLRPGTIAQWDHLRASQMWIRYGSFPVGDAEFTLAVSGHQILQTNLSRLVDLDASGPRTCPAEVPITLQQSESDMTLSVRAFFREDKVPDYPSLQYPLVLIGLRLPDADSSALGPSSTIATGSSTQTSPALATHGTGGSSGETKTEDPKSSSTNTGPIVGGVVAAVAALISVLALVLWLRRRARRRSGAGPDVPDALDVREAMLGPDDEARPTSLFVAAPSSSRTSVVPGATGNGKKSQLRVLAFREEDQGSSTAASSTSSPMQTTHTAGLGRSTTLGPAWKEPPPEYTV